MSIFSTLPDKRRQRTGTLWEGRYKANLIDNERYLLTYQRYIELNPARANMVKQPIDNPCTTTHQNRKVPPMPKVRERPSVSSPKIREKTTRSSVMLFAKASILKERLSSISNS